MKNHNEDQQQQGYYKKKRISSLPRKNTESCNIDFRRIKNSQSFQRQSKMNTQRKQIADYQLLKKLKLVSLIKNDYKSLKTICPTQHYIPYRRAGQSQTRRSPRSKYNQKLKQKFNQSLNENIKQKRQPYDKNGLLIFKIQMKQNESQTHKPSFVYKDYLIRSHHEQIKNIYQERLQKFKSKHVKLPSIKERATTQPFQAFEQDIIQKKLSTEPDLFLTNNENQQQLINSNIYQKKGKDLQKSKFKLKKKLNYSTADVSDALLRGTIKGWTRYDKMNQYLFIQNSEK